MLLTSNLKSIFGCLHQRDCGGLLCLQERGGLHLGVDIIQVDHHLLVYVKSLPSMLWERTRLLNCWGINLKGPQTPSDPAPLMGRRRTCLNTSVYSAGSKQTKIVVCYKNNPIASKQTYSPRVCPKLGLHALLAPWTPEHN